MIGQADLLEEGAHPLTAGLAVLQHEILRPDEDHLAHGEVPHALQRGQVDGFVAEAVAHRGRRQSAAGQRFVGQREIQVVAHSGREQCLEFGKRLRRHVQAALVAGGVLREIVNRLQVFAQVRDEGQRVGKGAEVIDPLQIARRDEGREAVRRGAEGIGQFDELSLEESNQPRHQWAERVNPAGFLEYLAARQQFAVRVSGTGDGAAGEIFEDLDLGSERALHHHRHHALDFSLQFAPARTLNRLAQLERYPVRGDARPQDGLVHISQFGLHLAGQVFGDGRRGGDFQLVRHSLLLGFQEPVFSEKTGSCSAR